ncbi:GNAT family N-acetyltransferase [Streptomyces halobius]|uniref:GNAT family N-acetyltransferase n=1 Tax=Streptomyces halobius TaxID=2879846 RepID=A0ABY4M4R1_9ACTN|nr:GNAT family N-acetyltransferase [Streptomyces halobius]UQA92253.1 GNAT family N-acetyltransferase [Streptomyces halobius]
MAAGMERARASGFRSLRLWVVRGNARAQRFYERAGLAPDGSEEAYEVGGISAPELRYWCPLPPGSGPFAPPEA